MQMTFTSVTGRFSIWSPFHWPTSSRDTIECGSHGRNVIVCIDDRTGDVIQSSFTTPDREKTASHAFRRLHPDERIAWTSVRAEEHDRFVVGIFYGRTRPPRHTFFAIDKSTDEVTLVKDDTPYRRSYRCARGSTPPVP
jgi:hypothetical protein